MLCSRCSIQLTDKVLLQDVVGSKLEKSKWESFRCHRRTWTNRCLLAWLKLRADPEYLFSARDSSGCAWTL